MKPALHPIATITRIAQNGKPITAPAHYFATERKKAAVSCKDWMKRHEGVGG